MNATNSTIANKNNADDHSLKKLYQMMLSAAGEQAPALQKSLLLGLITAVLRGLAFVFFVPLFQAVQHQHWHTVWTILVVMTVLLVVSSITDWFSRDYDYNGHAAKAGDRLRRQLGKQLRSVPLQTLYRQRTGELNASVASGVDDVINYSTTVSLMLINAIVIPIVVAIGVFFWDWRLGLALLVLFPSVLPIYLWIQPKMNQHKSEAITASATLNAETIEFTQGLPVLKSANCVDSKASRFNTATKAVQQIQIADMQSAAPANILLGSIIEIGMMLIVGLGLWLVSNGDISLMVLAGLMVAVIRFGEPLSVFISMMSVFELVRVGYQRLEELLAVQPLPQIQPEAMPTEFGIAFTNLEFSYENSEDSQVIAQKNNKKTKALSGIDLTVPANALTALVGASGCGKTTLIRMLMRFADPQSGSVKIGGVDIRQIEPEALNKMIAVVFQDVYLFDDTILANIRMGRADATEAEVYEAAKSAHCHDFIERLPNGYHTRVGDIGGNLSGGEKQRISIARALLKNAPIVILDEPTAALDTQSEIAVQGAIDALVKNKTVVVIAHRLSTIVAASQIVVMDAGKVVELGTHDDLINKNGRYAHLWQMQQGN